MRSDTKLRELILHIAKSSANDQKFGAVKLNKLLFYADFLSYFKRGHSITGQEYFAIREGPAPHRMLYITKLMVKNEELAYQEVDCGQSKLKKIPIALRPPNYEVFDGQDIAIADEIINKFRNYNGTELSDKSHKFTGYLSAFEEGEKTNIPYSTVCFDPKRFLGIEPPALTPTLLEHGRKVAKSLAGSRG